MPAETKIFTIWNESDYFNEELQTCTVSGTGYSFTSGIGSEKDTVKVNKDKTDKTEVSSSKKTKKIEDLIKKGTYKKGLFNTIQVKTDVYFEIPDSLMNRQFLVVNKLSQVPMQVNEAGLNKGMNYENKIISFHRDNVAKKIWVKTSDVKVSSPKNDAITKSVKDNFSESVIEVFDIEAQNSDSTAVAIKVNKVFDGNQKALMMFLPMWALEDL